MFRIFLQFWLKLPCLVDNFLEVSNEDKVMPLFLPFVGNLEVHFVFLINVSLCDVHVGIDD